MPVNQLLFQGINRAISDYAGGGACEELINLRPTATGLVPVKPFSAQMSSILYDAVFVHQVGTGTNYIGAFISGEPETSIYQLGIRHISADGTQIIQELGQPIYVGAYTTIDMVHFAAVGNDILISYKEGTVGRSIPFRWEDGEYREIDAHIPFEFSADISVDGSPSMKYKTGQPVVNASTTTTQLRDIISSGLNAIQMDNQDYAFGAFIVAIAFKTTDGKTMWTGNWMLIDPTPIAKAYTGEGFYDSSDDRFLVNTSSVSESSTKMLGQKYKITIGQVSDWDEDTSMLKSVEIYTSRPELYVNLEDILKTTYGDIYTSYAADRPISDMGLEGQLLYHQKSIDLKDLLTADQEYTFKFGGDIQTTNDTLVVDAGRVTRYGNVISYNSRFHYFDSVANIELHLPYFSTKVASPSGLQVDVFARYDDGAQDKTIYMGAVNLSATGSIPDIPAIIAPSLNIKEVMLYWETTGYYLYKFSMVESTTYNYSLNVTGTYAEIESVSQTDEMADLEDIKIDQGRTWEIKRKEPDAINVTEQYNPFVFNVDHSYLAPGKVLDIQPQMAPIPDVPYGYDPLDVFTNRGVFALLQGSGNVLYGGFQPIAPLVSEGKGSAVATNMGIFFLAADGMWMVSGRNATLVSDALSLGPHDFIRTCPGYQAICHPTTQITTTVYNIADYESSIPFKTFVNGANLSYNRFRDEVIVSKTGKAYSYVLSLKYRQWFKIDKCLAQDVVGSDIARTGTSVVSFATEADTASTKVLLHLQSRPFSMGYQYSHIYRTISMMRSKLVNGNKVVLALFGSDDLQEWKLLSYAGRVPTGTTTVKVSQLRTPSAARSWRYYTITIGGWLPVDTDFGPFMVDINPVIRRIG